MVDGGDLITLFTSPEREKAEALLAALERGGLAPVLEGEAPSYHVRLPPAQIARAAELMARHERTPRRAHPALLFVLAALALMGVVNALSRSAPSSVGQAMGIVFILVCAVRSAEALRLPDANRYGTYALFAYSASISLAGLVSPSGDGVLGSAAQPLAVSLALLFGAAFVLALVGLRRGYRSPDEHRSGRGHAWWALGLSTIALSTFTIGFVRAYRDRVETPLTEQTQPGSTLTNDDLNYAMNMPARPWLQIDAKKLNPDASMGFARGNVFFLILAEHSDGSLTSDSILELWRVRQSARDANMKFTPPTPLKLHGLDGGEASLVSRINAMDMFMVNRAFVNNGYVYQLVGWGETKDTEMIRREVGELASSFHQVDPERVSPSSRPPRQPIARFESPLYGYTADLGGAPWGELDTVATQFPSAEFGAACGGSGLLLVMAWPLLGTVVSEEAIVRVLASRLSLPAEDPSTIRAPVKLLDFHGQELSGVQTWQGNRRRFRARIVANKLVAIMIADLRDEPGDPDDRACPVTLEKITLGQPQIVANQIPSKERAAWLQMAIGGDAAEHGDLPRALALVKRSLVLDPTSIDAAWSLENVAAKAGKLAEAERVMDGLLAGAPDNSPLYAVRATILAGRNRSERALADYGRLFGAGYEDDDIFGAWAYLLEKQGQRAKALAEIERYQQHHDTPTIAILQAELLQRSGDLAKAIEILERRLETSDPEARIAIGLLGLYQAAEKHGETINTAVRLIEQGRGSLDVFWAKAKSEAALHWYAKSKETLEAAQRRWPDDPDIQRSMVYVSGMLGQGTNSAIKEPIAPVELPAALSVAKGEPPPGDHRAVVRSRTTAISFVKNKDFRTTEVLDVHVINQAGVELFSTLDFEIDPQLENIYVNKLEVFDASGALVRTGSVADCYLSDRASDEMGTAMRTLYVPIPGLQPGYSFALTTTRRVNSAPSEIWYRRHLLVDAIPTQRSTLFVRGDVAAVRHAEAGGVKATPVGDGIAWIVEKPLVYHPQPFDLPLERFAMAVWLGPAAATWESELAHYVEELAATVERGPEIEKLARKLTEGLESADARVNVLARYVQKELTYKAIEFGRGARVPRIPGDVLDHRYGDCKDHALLLQRMLVAVGVEAKLALVRTWGPIQHDVPSLDQFDHMIVYVPGPTPRFIDATSKWWSTSTGPSWLTGQEALLVDASTSRFVTIERAEDALPEIEIEREVKAIGKTTLEVVESVTASGWSALALRETLGSSEASRRAQAIQGWLGNVRVQSLEIDDLNHLDKPLKLRLRYLVDGQLHESNGQLVTKIPAPWEAGRLSITAVEDRANPFELRWPISFRSETSIVVPKDYQMTPLSANASTSGESFARWSVAVESAPQRSTLSFAYDRVAGSFPPDRYAALQSDASSALAALGQPVVFERKR